jgi:hypothetical protein
VHLATLRKGGSFEFPFVAPGAGGFECFWYEAPSSGARRSTTGKPAMLALAKTTYSGAGAKTVKLVLTAVARRLIRGTNRVPLSIKGVFLRPHEPRVTWNSSYLLSH